MPLAVGKAVPRTDPVLQAIATRTDDVTPAHKWALGPGCCSHANVVDPVSTKRAPISRPTSDAAKIQLSQEDCSGHRRRWSAARRNCQSGLAPT